MKKVIKLQYSARGGVQYERHLPKSAQFIGGCNAVVAVLTLVILSHGINFSKLPLFHSAAVVHHDSTQLVAHKAVALDATTVPSAPVESSEPDKLSATVQTYIDQNPAQTWSVAVYDIANQRWLAHINAQQQMAAGSLAKLYQVYALAEKVPAAQWPTTQIAGQSMQSCVDLMLRTYETSCSNAVTSLLGAKTIDSFSKSIGLTASVSNTYGGPVTSAYDAAHYMAMLYQGKLFDTNTTASLLNSLQHQTTRSGIPAGCANCTVYDKTSNSNSVAHDTGVVVSGNRTYAVAIMSEGGSNAQIAQIEKLIQSVLEPSVTTTSAVTATVANQP